MNQASQAPPGKKSADCEKLKKKNRKQRDKVVKNLEDNDDRTQEEQTTLEKAQGTGMTFSSAISRIPGAKGVLTGCSSGCAQACTPNQICEGGSSAQRGGCNAATRRSKARKHDKAKKDAGVLCGGSYVHPGGGKGAHAEAKIVNQLTQSGGAMKGGEILLNIDWRFKRRNRKNSSGMPCKSCYKMLCHAAKECDIKILLCDKDGREQPFPKDCNNEDSYGELSKRIDGKEKPGRGRFTGPHP
jgi:hypothetical protein